MARRAFAFVAMIAVIAIAIALMWRVYRHRQANVPAEEPSIVQRTLPANQQTSEPTS